MTIMVIQCRCLDIMWVEDRKLHSQLEWPYAKRNFQSCNDIYSKIIMRKCIWFKLQWLSYLLDQGTRIQRVITLITLVELYIVEPSMTEIDWWSLALIVLNVGPWLLDVLSKNHVCWVYHKRSPRLLEWLYETLLNCLI